MEAGGLAAEVHYDISAVAGELVTYETWYRFAAPGAGPGPGPDAGASSGAAPGTVVVPDTLRFMDQGQVAAFLAEAGLTQVTWHGDWDGSPCGPASPEIIAVAGAGRPDAGAGHAR